MDRSTRSFEGCSVAILCFSQASPLGPAGQRDVKPPPVNSRTCPCRVLLACLSFLPFPELAKYEWNLLKPLAVSEHLMNSVFFSFVWPSMSSNTASYQCAVTAKEGMGSGSTIKLETICLKRSLELLQQIFNQHSLAQAMIESRQEINVIKIFSHIWQHCYVFQKKYAHFKVSR